MMSPLYLIDSFALIFKSYYAMVRSPLTNARGENIAALLGLVRQVQQILRQAGNQETSIHLAMILDSSGPTFRHEIYPEYKANREEAPADLIAQLRYLPELLEKWGIPTYSIPGYEADDLIATLARRAASAGRDCYIVTSDKDLYQLVDGHIRILKLDKGRVETHRETYVVEKWGLAPRQLRDYLALVGDSSDNVPGVKGIGPKAAVRLLSDYQSLAEIYAHLGQLQPESMRRKLQDGREAAFLSYELVGLADRVPELLQPSWNEFWQQMEVAPEPAKPEFARFLSELGLKQLAREFEAPAKTKLETAAVPTTPAAVRQSYECIRSEERLRYWCERIRAEKLVAIDTETTGLNELVDELAGISLAVGKNQACYIPLQAPSDKPLLSSELLRKTLASCLGPEIQIVGQNFKFDYKVLANWGLPLPGIYFDTMIAAWLLDSLHPVGLDALAARYLNLKPIAFEDLIPKTRKKEKNFTAVPLEQAVPYAAEDADLTWQLYQVFARLLQERGLETLFFQLEMPLVRILGDMELRGIGCRRSELEAYAVELEGELGRLEDLVKNLTGEDFNLNSAQQLAEVLFGKLGLPVGKKTKNGYSTDNSILEKLRHFHPVLDPLLEYRRLSKLHSTYAKSFPRMILPRTKRIHPHFSVIGTETGRLSCKDPNLQNIPIREAAGRRIRNAFQPKPGWLFFSADYSQIELVVLAHLSLDPGLCAAFRSGRDIHQQTASQLFHLPLEKVKAEQRRIAKSINFGVIYGMSAFRLSQDLGLTRQDSRNFIDAYFYEFSGVRRFIDQTVARATEQGYVQTLAGRRREIRQLRSNNKVERRHGERMALNTVVQGSAADIVKQAMIRLDKELAGWQSQLLLQIHDELIFEVPQEERQPLQGLVPQVMEKAWALQVPLKVNSEWSARSWGDLH